MKFIDEAIIKVSSGNGGDGLMSFLRAKNLPRGGPDGGDGGRGGAVFFRGKTQISTLIDYQFQPVYAAQAGKAGGKANKTGASGKDLILDVPIGTKIADVDSGLALGEILFEDQTVLVMKGGEAGLGNCRFRSSTNRAPRQFTPGKKGETRTLKLELSLLADVGLVGLPNAGKSSLLRSISAAQPKVADYPFTTLVPKLGVVSLQSERSSSTQTVTVADIPGLILGASQGAGLGHQFLRHISRTKLLLHTVDAYADGQGVSDPSVLINHINEIRQELAAYDESIADKPVVLVLHKSDLISPQERENIENTLQQHAKDWSNVTSRLWLSSIQGDGIVKLKQILSTWLSESIGTGQTDSKSEWDMNSVSLQDD